jgi:hypothetical protein
MVTVHTKYYEFMPGWKKEAEVFEEEKFREQRIVDGQPKGKKIEQS